MSSLQSKIVTKLKDHLQPGPKRKETTHESIKGDYFNCVYIDHERDIIVYVVCIDDEKMREIRIKKKNKKTGKFEFLGYNEQFEYSENIYNQKEGHLIMYKDSQI